MRIRTHCAWGVVALSATLLCSCGRQKAETTQESPVGGEKHTTLTAVPVYTNIEAYINNYAYGPSSGGQTSWSNAYPTQVVMTTTLRWDGKDYTFELEYKGSEPKKDHYRANITCDGSTGFTGPLTYEGAEIEVWRDNKVRVGLRPKQ